MLTRLQTHKYAVCHILKTSLLLIFSEVLNQLWKRNLGAKSKIRSKMGFWKIINLKRMRLNTLAANTWTSENSLAICVFSSYPFFWHLPLGPTFVYAEGCSTQSRWDSRRWETCTECYSITHWVSCSLLLRTRARTEKQRFSSFPA